MIPIDQFKVIGIALRTTNQGGQSVKDVERLWAQFFAENIMVKIPNKAGDEIYSIYTDYESDYSEGYTHMLGLRVHDLDNVPDGLIGRVFEADTFSKFVARGEMPNAIIEVWKEIWNKDKVLDRKYSYDFEVYTEKSQNGAQSEVEVFIATHPK